MTKHMELKAEARAKAGKGSARAIRREKKVPGVIYGDNKEPVLLAIEEKELVRVSSSSTFFASIFDLSVDGKKHSVLPRDVQLHPVSDRPVHVDFMRVTDKMQINVEVPVHLLNADKCKGVVKGGVINLIRHQLEIVCSASNIPETIEFDVKDIDVGESVHIGALTLPKGVSAVDEDDVTFLTLVAPSAMKSEDDAKAVEAAATAAAPAAKAPAAGAKAAPAAAPAKKK